MHGYYRVPLGCGEEPDSGEDLQIQYIDTNGAWVTLNTWAGATSGGNAQQWTTNLPQAALHANTQIRINQISGSGSGATCCDFWFVDDVHLASPPESHWISPTIGWGQGATQLVSEASYAPVFLDANIPSGAFQIGQSLMRMELQSVVHLEVMMLWFH